MRLYINAASAHMGGAVTYLQNILRWLPEVAPEWEIEVCVPKATLQQLAGLRLPGTVTLSQYPHVSSNGVARFYFDQVQVPLLLKRTKADVLFSCTGFGTFFSPRPQVLLIRNPIYFDQLFHETYRRLKRSLFRTTTRRWLSIASARASDVILFPTVAMQNSVEQYVSLDDKITAAIHYGFDPQAFSADEIGSSSLLRWVDDWKKEGGFVLLNVSTYAVHKNYETAIRALAAVKEQGIKVCLLTTLSREKTADKDEYDDLKRQIMRLGLDSEFVELGYVPYRELGILYGRADAYLFPSLTESFGHTMVEAMAAGLPVIAAGTPVNEEVCGEAGRYFDTLDPMSCASVLTEVLLDPDVREEMSQRSIQRAKHFSWQSYAIELVRMFEVARDALAPAHRQVKTNPAVRAGNPFPRSSDR